MTISTTVAVLTLLVAVLAWWFPRRNGRKNRLRSPPTSRERLAVLQRVRQKWISDFLARSLDQTPWLALGLMRCPETLDPGTRARYGPGLLPKPVPPGTPISEVFDQTGGGLLILGEPGAGKTILLLQLTSALLDRAESDPNQPLPVVVNLASWASRRQPLAAWLVEELNRTYNIPARTTRAWVDANALALMLDGLDEVASAHRRACVEAINAYRRDHGLVPLVVCGRTRQLEAVETGLRLEEAVELQPPSDAQIASYFDQVEARGTPLDDVRAALGGDRQLRAMVRSPLLLQVVARAYGGFPASALRAPGSLAEREARLWSAYVTRMFEQRPLAPGGYTPQRAVSWLAWLAYTLGERDQSEFHLDRLEPGWLRTETLQKEAGDVVELAAGLLVGVATGVITALVDGLSWGILAGLLSGGAAVLIARSAGRQAPVEELRWTPGGFLLGSGGGLLGGLLGGLISQLAGGGLASGVQDLGVADSMAHGLGFGLAFGLLFGLAGRLIANRARRGHTSVKKPHVSRGGLAVGLLGGLAYGMATGGAYGLAGGLTYGLVYGLVFGLIFGMVGGVRAERITPNEGIRRCARRALLAGLAVPLGLGLAAWGPPRLSLLELQLPLGLLLALVFGGGTWLRHYAVRAMLAKAGAAPWRYQSFLDAMADRLLLRRSGSAYLFVHGLLRDHLAELAAPHGQS